jgi:uncharacterized protein (TIGR04255 family)
MGTPLKNPPVYFTVVQVRFNALLKLADYLPAIQEAMRKGGYPDFAHQSSVGIQISIQDGQPRPSPIQQDRYKFGDVQRTHAFWLDADSLTLQSTDYGHFDKFADTFLKGLSIVHDIVTLDYTERIGLRYLDRVTPRAGDDVSQYLAPEVLGLSGRLPGQALHAYSESVNQVQDVVLRSRVVIQGGGLSFPPDLAPEDMVVTPRFTQYVGPHAILDNDGVVQLREVFSLDIVARRLKDIHDVIGKAFKAAATPHAFAVWDQA